VTADVEAGYGDSAEKVAETAELVIEAGAVGVNLEDGASPPDLLAAKIRAVRERVAKLRAGLFVNARIDVMLYGLKPAEERVDEILRRAEIYAEAGADGLFVPGLRKSDEIARIAKAIQRPLNVMLVPGLPPTAQLRELGVARLSAGGSLQQAALGATRRWAKALLEGREPEHLGEAIPHVELNELFPKA
jgi:2-methylisocitrate lyase-like PEP mutase family enzyme